MKLNRYPGVKPFEQQEHNLFNGREQDIENLYELILLEKIIVLYGKSGYGKSSLLNAGVIPKINGNKDVGSHYIPIMIRFGIFINEKNAISPLAATNYKLDEQLKPTDRNNYLAKLPISDTLWYQFKRRQTKGHNKILLIFDQFEEFFSYPTTQQEAFKKQLAQLLFVTIPQKIRDVSDELPDQEYDLLVERMEIKTIFAIRSDRMSLLDQFKDALPSILNKRYELKPLNHQQAKAAIVLPAMLLDDQNHHYHSPPFQYSPAALNVILQNLSGKSEAEAGGIESFQLQIICQHIERSVRTGEIKEIAGSIIVQELDLPNMTNIYEDYYKKQIDLLEVYQQKAARAVIEEGLLLVNHQTGEGRRLSVDGGALIDRYKDKGVEVDLLQALVDCFLLRREPNTTNGFNYEISHDTLIEPIAKARIESEKEELLKREKKLKEEAEIERLRQEEKISLVEEKLAAERKAYLRQRNYLRLVGLIALLAIISAVSAVRFYQDANRLKISADEAKEKAEQQTKVAEANLDKYEQQKAKEYFEKAKNIGFAADAQPGARKNEYFKLMKVYLDTVRQLDKTQLMHQQIEEFVTQFKDLEK